MLGFGNLDTSAALLSWRKKKAMQVDIMKAWAALLCLQVQTHLQEGGFAVSILLRGFPIARLCSLLLKKTYRRKIPPGFSPRKVHASPKKKECIYMNPVTIGTIPALTHTCNPTDFVFMFFPASSYYATFLTFCPYVINFFHRFEFGIILLAISYYTFHCCSVIQSLVKWKSLSHVWIFVILLVNSPSQNTGVGSHSLLQGIFPTQGSNPGLPHCRWILYCLSHQRSPSRCRVWLFVTHGLQYARLPCPSPSPGACSNSRPLSQRCHPTICLPLILLPSIFPMIFSNDSALHIRWPKYWSFSFSIGPSSEHSGFISFRIDWIDHLPV